MSNRQMIEAVRDVGRKVRWIGRPVKQFGGRGHQSWTTEGGPDLIEFAELLEATAKEYHREKNARALSEEKRMANFTAKVIDSEYDGVSEPMTDADLGNEFTKEFSDEMEGWDDSSD